MTQQRQGVREMRLVWETEPNNYPQTTNFLLSQIYDALQRVKNAHISMTIYNLDGSVDRTISFGEPTDAMKALIEDEAMT